MESKVKVDDKDNNDSKQWTQKVVFGRKGKKKSERTNSTARLAQVNQSRHQIKG